MPLALFLVSVLIAAAQVPPVQARDLDLRPSPAFQEDPSQEAPANNAPGAEPNAPSTEKQSGAEQTPPQKTPASESGAEAQGAASQPTKKTAPQATTPSKKPRKKKSAGQAGASPSKRVVRNGSAPDPTVQIAPEVSPKQASNEQQNTNQLLAATEGNLKTISERGVKPSQQSVVDQIHQYMEQSKQATSDGDPARAHNLALKAHLLSLDLVKH